MRPESSALQDLVRQLHHDGTPWLPCGLASRLDWGAPVAPGCGSLSCAALDRILEHNPGDFTITVEAGAPLAAVQQALAEHGQWLAVDRPWGTGQAPASAGSIGGLVARGLAGGYRQRYLGIRDQLIGIRVLRADGVEARAGGKVVKNVAGYDLMRLFTGSWGSLGLITEVTLRTLPLPPQRRGLLVQGSLQALAELSRKLLHSSLTPERVDWWSASLAAAAGLEAQPLVVVGLASIDAASLNHQIATLRSSTALACRDLAAEELHHLHIVARGATAAGVALPRWLLRLGVNPDQISSLLAAPELDTLAVDLAVSSGLGMAWTLGDLAGPSEPMAERIARLRQVCGRLGGHLTVLRQPADSPLASWEDAPSRPLIEAVKYRFDPRAQLAPNRLPGVRPTRAQCS
jgi:glycolate oxidase FAD binding subunit